MREHVIAYTEDEGGQWRRWPFQAYLRPTYSALKALERSDLALLELGPGQYNEDVVIRVHAIQLDNGQVWDSIHHWRGSTRGCYWRHWPTDETVEDTTNVEDAALRVALRRCLEDGKQISRANVLLLAELNTLRALRGECKKEPDDTPVDARGVCSSW